MDAFIELLREAGGKVGIEAIRLWPQIVGITFVKSVFWTVATPLLVVAWVVATRWLRGKARALNAADRDMDRFDTFAVTASAVLLVAIGGFLVAALVSDWPNNIVGVFYPEAKTVLDLITKAK